MTARRSRGQSLVELALVAPILILLAMSVWDGGSVLREQVVLQQAARDGARVAATGYGHAVLDTVVADAVAASARDLPGLSSAVSYPDPQSVQVRVTYVHSLITPVLRQVWAGGSGTISLQASATFYLPQLTPVPATLVLPTATPSPTLAATATATPVPAAISTPSSTATLVPTATATSTPLPTAAPTLTSTPLPTATPTRTATPSPTATITPVPATATPTSTLVPSTATPTSLPTATPTPGITTCKHAITIPSLDNDSGYWFVVQLNVPSYLDATWTMPDAGKENIELYIYSNLPTNPFAGQPDPTSLSPPSDELISDKGNTNSLEVRTPQANLTGSFSVYFFKRGQGLSTPTDAVLEYQSRQCP